MSKRLLWLPPILGLLAFAALLWRIQVLSVEVDRLAHRPEAAPPSRLPEGVPVSSDAPRALLEPTQLAASGPNAAPGLERLRSRVESLEKELHALRETGKAWEQAVEEMTEARLRANQIAAIATSRNVISALAQVQASAKIDEDSDGTGEYGGFLELSGAAEGRMLSVLNPPVLPGAFRLLSPAGEAQRSGYLFRIYLPDARGQGVGEPATGFPRGAVDPQLAETTWCLYAWPVERGRTGLRTFFTNQGGDVLATDTASYSGSGAGPAPDAAFLERGTITGRIALDARGADGNEWKHVN